MLGTVFMPLLVSFHQARKRAMQAQGQAAGRVRAEHSELVLPQEPQARTAVLVDQIPYLWDPRSCSLTRETSPTMNSLLVCFEPGVGI